MQRDRKRSVLLLSVAAVLLALIGAGLIGAYAVLSKRAGGNSAAPSGPMSEWVPVQAITERLALLTLAGWTDQAVIDRCLIEGEIDTAFSVLSGSVTLADRTRAGLLLRVAAGYTDQERRDLAGAIYQKVSVLAVLSSALSDLSRVELLVQAAVGLSESDRNEDAGDVLEQAATLVGASTELKPAQREQLAASVQKARVSAGIKQGGDANMSRNLSDVQTGMSQSAVAAFPFEAFVNLDEEAISSDSLRNIQAARRNAAQELIEFQEARPGEQPAALVAGLSDVLLAENARVAEDVGALPLPTLAQTEWLVQWTALKRQIAGGRTGISLAPEWELLLTELDDDSRAAWEQLFAARREVVASMHATDREQVALQGKLLGAELLAGELGLIPGYDLMAAAERLQVAMTQLRDLGSAWWLDVSLVGESPRYGVRAP